MLFFFFNKSEINTPAVWHLVYFFVIRRLLVYNLPRLFYFRSGKNVYWYDQQIDLSKTKPSFASYTYISACVDNTANTLLCCEHPFHEIIPKPNYLYQRFCKHSGKGYFIIKKVILLSKRSGIKGFYRFQILLYSTEYSNKNEICLIKTLQFCILFLHLMTVFHED